MDYKENFQNIEWETPATGVKQKIINRKNQQVRLLRFGDNFMETDWCTKAHDGNVLEGEMQIDFEGIIVQYKKGDALKIEEGRKHKAIIEKGKFVELLLHEKI